MTWPPTNVEAASLDDPHTLNLLAEFGWPLTPPSDATFVDILLKQGDVLYLPPGVWHEACTDETHSLHYTPTFYPISTWNVLFASLRAAMMKHPEWRRDLRFLGATGSDGEEAVVNRMLTTLRQELDKVTARDLLATYRATEGLPLGFRSLFRTP
jgi:ribosomal protein L16 Arg81 hydroxylase